MATDLSVALRAIRRQYGAGAASVPIAIALLLLWVWSGVAPTYSQQVVLGLATGSLYALLALAIVLIYRSASVVNFAQGELATLSTFIAWSLLQRFGDRPAMVWVVLALTAAIAAALGAALYVLVMSRIPHGAVLRASVVVLGFFTIFSGFTNWRWGSTAKAFPSPFSTGTVSFGHVTVTVHTLGMMVVAGLVMALAYALFRHTRLGLAMRATAEDPLAAQLVGIQVGRMLMLGWALSTAVGAVAGVLIAHTLNLSPAMMFNVLLFALAAAVLGGLASPGGAVLGGLVVGVAQNVVGVTEALGGTELRLFWAFVLIIAVLLVRPQGLFGRSSVGRL